MSVAWYHHKIEQCLRLAKEAPDERSRALHEQEARLWRKIAEDIVRNERNRFGSIVV